MINPVLSRTDLDAFPIVKRGKVRDLYDVGEQYLIVSTDRLSAYDVVFNEPIPYKGAILNQLSAFWFDLTRSIVANHYISSNIIEDLPILIPHRKELELRSMLVRKATPLPFECIVRGYLMGSAFEEYKKTGAIAGKSYGHGLVLGSKFNEPLFTPSTKSDTGHDVNVSYDYLTNALGETLSNQLREVSLALFQFASSEAIKRGLILVDTKFEFGQTDEGLLLIDEIFTPDSSRYVLKTDYDLGFIDRSLDKQYVRNFVNTTSWNKEPPPPALPDEIVQKTSERYLLLFELLTGKKLAEVLNNEQ
jgi:phosphoribosylaminoimidazole-succinocarboxamide synthase